MASKHPITPDGRYFVAKGRLWRKADPSLSAAERKAAVVELMAARRAVRDAETQEDERDARAAVHAAKLALGERGPVWWSDGAADETRRSPKNSSYADWWAGLSETERKNGVN